LYGLDKKGIILRIFTMGLVFFGFFYQEGNGNISGGIFPVTNQVPSGNGNIPDGAISQ
jgi:hypothetical protein